MCVVKCNKSSSSGILYVYEGMSVYLVFVNWFAELLEKLLSYWAIFFLSMVLPSPGKELVLAQ